METKRAWQQSRPLRRPQTVRQIGGISAKPRIYRFRIDEASLSCFVDFIVSSDYLHDVAFGDKKIKLECDSIDSNIIIPNVLWLATNSSVISDYHEMCISENITPLSESKHAQHLI